ncbi:response regulator [candidate division KSB1 bacterium]|nr:response regulator [candidate division KSB1 bacterium]
MEQKKLEKPVVLIVDDEMIMRDSLSAWLDDEGFETITTEWALDALKIIKNRAIDVAIVDIKMPVMDGITFLKKIKETHPELPIIMITAHATVESAIEAMKEGAYDYVMKPFPPEKLTNLIRRVVEHQRVVQENVRLINEKKGFYHLVISLFVVFTIFFLILYFIVLR